MTSTRLLQLLIHRLGQRNVCVDHIPALVRNVLQIVSDGGLFTTRLVNGQLEQLGWGSKALDETCFQLIVYILESEWGYRVGRYNFGSTEADATVDWRLKKVVDPTNLNQLRELNGGRRK